MQNEIPSSHISGLPQEVVEDIFKYLTAADRRAASETCSSWFFAANISRFTRGQFVTLCHRNFEKNPSPILMCKNSRFCHQHYQFKNVDIQYLNQFADELGQRIKSLVLYDKSDSNKVTDISFLKKCPNLEILRINLKCYYEFWKSIDTTLEFPFLRTLDLAKNLNVTDALFHILTRHAPALEEIILAFCNMHQNEPSDKADGGLCHNALIPLSHDQFTYSYFCTFLTIRRSNIRHLNLSYTVLDYKKPMDTSFLKNENLRLLSLDISGNLYHNESDNIISDIVKYQFHLKKLHLDECLTITDRALEYISTHLENLEDLSLNSACDVTDLGMIQLQKLKKLKSLNISECSNITGNSFINGICRVTNSCLEELNISCTKDISENDLIIILQRLPNLRFLDITSFWKEYSDSVIQTIIKHLIKLKVLIVQSKFLSNYLITDAGFTGVNSNSSTKNIQENEVLSLVRLKQLTYLNLSGLKNLTDRTLQYAVKSTMLQKLNLRFCTSITPDGFKYLWKNCPNLESLDVSYCEITDSLIIEMATNLKQLRTLYIFDCTHVSNRAINAIKKIRKINCYNNSN